MRNPFTEEQEKWLAVNWVRYGGACVDMFNDTFGQNRAYDTIRTHCKRKGYRCNENVLSKRGRNNARIYEPIGTVKVNHGYKYIKVADEVGQRSTNWVLYHRYVYEKEYGEIPNKHYIIFLDGDKMNCDAENLCAVPRSHTALLNRYQLRSENAELTKTAVVWCDLHEALRKESDNGTTD